MRVYFYAIIFVVVVDFLILVIARSIISLKIIVKAYWHAFNHITTYEWRVFNILCL